MSNGHRRAARAATGAAPGRPGRERIECYDISHTQGTSTVASMVVFVHGRRPRKSIAASRSRSADQQRLCLHARGVAPPLPPRQQRSAPSRPSRPPSLDSEGDGAALGRGGPRTSPSAPPRQTEVIISNGAQPATRDAAVLAATRSDATNWTGWAVLPDLVIIDGGKGQLSAGLEVMRELGLTDLPTVGLAKEREEIFRPGASVGLLLPPRGRSAPSGAAHPRRGAPLRHRLPPQAAQQEGVQEQAGRHSRHRPQAQGRPAASTSAA